MKHLIFAALLIASTAFAQEDKLIATLKADAPLKDKVDACRELARVGTRQAVPALSPLLADEQLSHMARFALEPIPDPSVDAALRDALGKVQGRLLTGVIDSLAARKDKQAVEPIARFLTASDPAVAQAAARALGTIGGSTAAQTLQAALASSPSTQQLAIAEGLLRCAEGSSGSRATAIYDKLRSVPNLPHHLRVAALSGAIRSRGAKGIPLMVEAVQTESYVPAADALRISMDLPGSKATRALVKLLAQVNEEKQLLIFQTLGNRGDTAAAPDLVPLTREGSPTRRTAAIRCLAQLATPASLPVLTTLVKDPEPAVSAAALTALTGFPGKKADAAMLALLNEAAPKASLPLIDAAVQRRITAVIPTLFKTAAASDAAASAASFKALGELAAPAEIPGVIDAMIKSQNVAAGEAALTAICSRQTNMALCAEQLLPGFAAAQGEAKLALLRVLGAVGDQKALAAVRTTAAESAAPLNEAALRILCNWPTAEALGDLVRITKTHQDAKFKLLALRGQLRLIPTQTAPDSQKVSQLKQLLPMLQQQEEQRIALAALGDLPSPDSLAVILPFLENESLKEEASIAAVSVGEKIVAAHPAEVAAAMKQVQTKDAQLAARVQKLLKRAQKPAQK